MGHIFKNLKENLFFFFLFLVVVLIVYFPTILGEPFWDDWIFIFVRQRYQFGSSSPLVFFPGGEFPKAWPVFYSFLWLLIKLFKDQYLFYHLTSILLHSLNGFLFYSFLKRIKFKHSLLLSFAYLVHPAHLYTVAWIIQIKTLLAIFFFLISLNILITKSIRHHWQKLFISIVFFAASIFSKATTVGFIFPLIFSYRYFKSIISQRLYLTLIIAPIVILATWATFTTAWNFKINNDVINSSDEKILYESEKLYLPDIAERVLTTSKVFFQYLKFNLYPFDSAQLYQERVVINNSSLEFLTIISTVCLFSYMLYFLYRENHFLFLALTFYTATLLPFCGMIYIPIFDSSNFIPYWLSIPLLGLIPLFSYFNSKKFLILVFIFWSAVTHFQSYNFIKTDEIFIKSIEKNPDSMSASVALIEHYIFTKRCEKANDSYRKFIQATNIDLSKIKQKLKECHP